MTGNDNIFSVPEYSGGADGKELVPPRVCTRDCRLCGRAALRIPARGPSVLFITRKVSPGSKNPAAAANA